MAQSVHEWHNPCMQATYVPFGRLRLANNRKGKGEMSRPNATMHYRYWVMRGIVKGEIHVAEAVIKVLLVKGTLQPNKQHLNRGSREYIVWKQEENPCPE